MPPCAQLACGCPGLGALDSRETRDASQWHPTQSQPTTDYVSVDIETQVSLSTGSLLFRNLSTLLDSWPGPLPRVAYA